jgi:Zn-dependent protease with chaperone function
MIAAESLIGFGLAFLFTTWASSILLGVPMLLAGAWLRRRGPRVEQAACAAGTLVPPLVGAATLVTLIVGSAAALAGGADHCPAHLHHLHLCLLHGAAWGGEAWAVATVAFAAAVVVTRLARMAVTQIAARRALARLQEGAVRVGEVVRVASPHVFCFVAGLRRPRVYLSTAAWDLLGDDGRAAALAHERRHAERHDVARRLGLGALALLGAPLVARTLLLRWSSATERRCDREAAEIVGDPTAVAEALVALARRAGPVPACAAAFPPADDELSLRVEALLGPAPDDRRAASLLWRGASIAALGAASAIAVQADALHHLLETILGAL